MTLSLRRLLPVLVLPLLLGPLAGCGIVTARSKETTEWNKTYQLTAGGRVEINDVNGKIAVEPSTGNTVDVTAIKRSRGGSPDAAKAALDRVTIVEDVSPSRIRIDTKWPNLSRLMFNGGRVPGGYRVKVPAVAEGKL